MQLRFSKSENLIRYEFEENITAIEFTEIAMIKGLLSELTLSVIFRYTSGVKAFCPVSLILQPANPNNKGVDLISNITMPKIVQVNQNLEDVESVSITCESAEKFEFTLTCNFFK
jgi:hypothetical protein